MNINFNPINRTYTNNNQINSRVSFPNIAPLKQDTVSFKSKVPKPKDLMDLTNKEIIEICKSTLLDKIPVGHGQEAVVYKMEKYPREYCIRVEKDAKTDLKKLKLDYNLNDYDKANFVIAKLADGITLLRYISGIPMKIMHNSDTPRGIQVKESLLALIADNFSEEAFVNIIKQIEKNQTKGIFFDRKGENLLVDPMIQEMTAIDFSPKFNDIEYNPIAYIYSALDVDSTEFAPKIFGKLCNAYAERLKDCNPKDLNLDVLDKNFYHRGFMDDAFNNFPDRDLLKETQDKLFNELIDAKLHKPKEEVNWLVDEFKSFVDDKLINYQAPRCEFY